jgi:hypothetical protein
VSRKARDGAGGHGRKGTLSTALTASCANRSYAKHENSLSLCAVSWGSFVLGYFCGLVTAPGVVPLCLATVIGRAEGATPKSMSATHAGSTSGGNLCHLLVRRPRNVSMSKSVAPVVVMHLSPLSRDPWGGDGQKPDCSTNRDTATFLPGQFPPLNAFWQVTISVTERRNCRVTNPINRYLSYLPTLPQFKKNSDESIELSERLAASRQGVELAAGRRCSNLWAIRLYWPKQMALCGS